MHQQQQHNTQQSSSQNGKKQPSSNTDYSDTNISYNSKQNAIITNNINSNNNNNNTINKTNHNNNANSQFPINTKPKLLRSYSKYKIDNNNNNNNSNSINRAQANQSNLGINASISAKPNNGLEYNPLAGVSFKANHTSDVEIVGVKLKNSNQESSLTNYGNNTGGGGGGGNNIINPATKKKNSLQGKFLR